MDGDYHKRRMQRLNLGGLAHFAIIGNVGGEAERCCHKLRFETRRCVKMLTASPIPLSWIWGREERRENGKGYRGKVKVRWKGRKGRGEGRMKREMEIRGSLHASLAVGDRRPRV